MFLLILQYNGETKANTTCAVVAVAVTFNASRFFLSPDSLFNNPHVIYVLLQLFVDNLQFILFTHTRAYTHYIMLLRTHSSYSKSNAKTVVPMATSSPAAVLWLLPAALSSSSSAAFTRMVPYIVVGCSSQ